MHDHIKKRTKRFNAETMSHRQNHLANRPNTKAAFVYHLVIKSELTDYLNYKRIDLQ